MNQLYFLKTQSLKEILYSIKTFCQKALLWSLLAFPIFLNATVIIPPENMEEFINITDYVIYGKITSHVNGDDYMNNFSVLEVVKGDLSVGDVIKIKEYGWSDGNITSVVDGDVDFKMNQEYLLFLFKDGDGNFKTNLMSFSVYENGEVNGYNLLAHSPELLKLQFAGNVNPDFTGAYKKDEFLKHLHNIARGNTSWNFYNAGYIEEVFAPARNRIDDHQNHGSSRAACPNIPPAHCTTLIGSPTNLNATCNAGSPAKFASNNWTVCVSSSAGSDPSQASALMDLQNAVTAMNGMPGVNISYAGGTAACAVACPSGTVANDAIACNGGGSTTNKAWVFFNDPCNQIADLSGCVGTLGIGGHFNFNTCHTDPCGNMWKNATTPYFVMNNGAGCTGTYSYTAVLTHEMLHSIGLGHIHAGMACTALMNPIICNANETAMPMAPNFGITSLDDQCTDWMYNISMAASCMVAGTGISTSVCANSTTAIDLASLLTGADAGGTWSQAAGTGGTFAVDMFTPNGATPGTFTFTYTIAADGSCPEDTEDVTVIVNPLANAGTGTDITICETDSALDLAGQLAGEQTGGTWTRLSGLNGTFVAGTGMFTPAVGATTSTFRYTVSATGCPDDTEDVVVTINVAANAGTAMNITACETAGAIDLGGQLAGEQAGGTWIRTVGTGGTFVAGTGMFTPAVGATTSTFTYAVTGNAPCVDDTEDVVVTIVTAPDAGTATDISICETDGALDLAGQLAGEQTGGTWTRTAGTGGTFVAGTGMFTPAVGATTSTFRYTVSAMGCPDDTEDVVVTINAAANAGTAMDITACETAGAIDLGGQLTGEQVGGTWTRTAGTGGTFVAGTGMFTPAVGATMSTFTYTITGNAPCVDDTEDVVVTIVTAPDAGTATDLTICSEGSVDLFNQLAGEDTGGTWTRINGTGGTLTGSIFASASGATTSTFRYTASAIGCPDDTEDVIVTIMDRITAITVTNINPCANIGTDSDDGNDTFTADVTVTFANPPTTGNLTLSGDGTGSVAVSSLTGTNYTFSNVSMPADAGTIALTADFSDLTDCSFSNLNAGTAPNQCSISFTDANGNSGGTTDMFMAEDPCTCNGDQELNADGSVATTGTLSETVTVSGPSGRSLQIPSNAATIGLLDPTTGNPFTYPIPLIETPMGSGTYTITFNHVDRVGYNIAEFQFLNAGGNYETITTPTFDNIALGNVCAYPIVQFSPALASEINIEDPIINLGVSLVGSIPTFTQLGTSTFTVNNTVATTFNPADNLGANTIVGTYDIVSGTGQGGTLAAPAIPLDADGNPANGVCLIEVSAAVNVTEATLIPTMSQWGLMIFGLLIMNLGVYFVYRKELTILSH